jgi:hypothetical protein
MALSEELPLYKDCLALLNRVIPLTKDFPRFFRYGIGSRMIDFNLEMISLIYQANSSYEKVKILEDLYMSMGLHKAVLKNRYKPITR